MTPERGNAPGSAPEALAKTVSCEADLTSPLTWAALVEAEPRLADLEAQARLAHQMPGPRCTNAVWYGRGNGPSMKRRYSELVGWGRPRSAPGPKWLRSSEAYEVGYAFLYDALPCDVGPDGCRCESW